MTECKHNFEATGASDKTDGKLHEKYRCKHCGAVRVGVTDATDISAASECEIADTIVEHGKAARDAARAQRILDLL